MLFYNFSFPIPVDLMGFWYAGSCLLEGRGKGAWDEVMLVVVVVIKKRWLGGRGVVR